jgi:hypothetical protein
MKEDQEFEMTLPVTLTRQECTERAAELARWINKQEVAESGKKVASALYKGQIDEADGEISRMARIVREEKEPRMVKCIPRTNWGRKLMETIRLDTNIVIASRPLTATEYQQRLPMGDAATFGAAVRDSAEALRENLMRYKTPSPEDDDSFALHGVDEPKEGDDV